MREATDGETEEFLQNDFVVLRNEYDASKVRKLLTEKGLH